MSDVVDLGAESLLGDSFGEDAQGLRDRLDLALRYIANWYKATADSNKDAWWPKIDDVRALVEAAFVAMDPSQVFPGKDELAIYEQAALAFPALWRELTLSEDTLPHRDLVDRAADFLGTVAEFPAYLLPKIGDIIGRAVGGALGRMLEQLWPYLALAGAGAGVYFLVRSGAKVRLPGLS